MNVETYINGQKTSDMPFDCLSEAIRYMAFQENALNDYVVKNNTHVTLVVLRSKQYGNQNTQLFFEDKVNKDYLQKSDEIIDSIDKTMFAQ
jgi:hypothetical protein